MYYTIICKTGFISDRYRVAKTFTSKRAAENFTMVIETRHVHDYGFIYRIVSHKKPLSELVRAGRLVVFAGGRTAFFDDSPAFKAWLENKLHKLEQYFE
jgi:hypothetical protein